MMRLISTAVLALVVASPAIVQERACPVLKVLDGDTFTVTASCLGRAGRPVSIRLRDADAPELRGRCESERQAAIAAKAFAEEQLAAAARVLITSTGRDKWWRRRITAIAILVGGDGSRRSLSELLIAAGHARRYDGGRRQAWCP